MIYTTNNTDETKKIGYELARELDEKAQIKFIALRGEMGVGKTAFTSGFASYFGINAVKSPTYTVMNEYRGAGRVIYHFDMYRITDGDDLYSIGYYDYIDSGAYCIVEWSENIEEYLPSETVTVTIERVPDLPDSRRITINY